MADPTETISFTVDQIIDPISIIERSTSGGVRMPCHIPLFIGKIRTETLT
jgi:hypothetical protein